MIQKRAKLFYTLIMALLMLPYLNVFSATTYTAKITDKPSDKEYTHLTVSQGNLKMTRIATGQSKMNPDGTTSSNGNKTIFSVSGDVWSRTGWDLTCTEGADLGSATKDYIVIPDSEYFTLKQGRPARGVFFTYLRVWKKAGFVPYCGWEEHSNGPITVSPPEGVVEATFSWNLPTGAPNALKIIQSKPTSKIFSYKGTWTAKETNEYYAINSVYQEYSNEAEIIRIPDFSLQRALPSQGYWIHGNVTQETLITNNGVMTTPIAGFVWWSGKEGKVIGYPTEKDMKVELHDTSLPADDKNYTIDRYQVDRLTGGFDLGSLKDGSYQTSISYNSDSIAAETWEDFFGGENTTVTGSSNFKIKEGKLEGTPDIELTIKKVVKEGFIDDALNKLLTGLMEDIKNGLGTYVGLVMTGVVKVIDGTGNIDRSNAILGPWTNVKNLAIGLLTLGLLIIAFANILQIDIEKYGLNRMIPKIVIAIIMAQFSYLICKAILQLSTAFSFGLKELATNQTTPTEPDAAWNAVALNVQGTGIFDFIFIILLLMGVLLVALWLMLILYVREVVIIFLVVLAPLAFMMQIMPFTEKLYGMWWSKFWQWVFVGPVTVFFIYLGTQFFHGYVDAKGKTNTPFSAILSTEAYGFLILVAVCWGIAAYVPLIMGKEVYGKISKPAKNMFNKVPYVRKTKAMLSARSAEIDKRYKNAANASRQRLMFDENGNARGGLHGMVYRNLAGVTPDQLPQAYQSMIEETAKNHTGDLDTLKREAVTGGIVGDAAIWRMASDGTLPTPDITKDPQTDVNEARARQIATRVEALSGRLPGLRGKVQKENKDYAAGVTAVNPNSSFAGAAASGIRGVEDVSKLKPAQWQLASQDRDLLRELISSQGALGKLFREGGAKSKTAAARAIAAHEDLRRSLPLELRNQINTTLGRPLEQMENMTDQEHRNYGPPPPGHQFGDESG